MLHLTPAQSEAMDETSAWAIAHVERPRKMAPDAEVEARYGALQQSLAHYRKAGGRRAFTRADSIIAGAQRDSSEIGSLRGEVRRLCDEIDAMSNPDVSPAAAKCNETWGYADVAAGEEFSNALVRCFYDDDPDGEGDLRAVYLAGYEITLALTPGAIEAIAAKLRDELAIMAEEHNVNLAISRAAF